MNKGYIKTAFVLLSLIVYSSNRAIASESVPDVGNSNTVSKKNIASNENREKGNLQACIDPEETEKATEIMDKAIYRLKHHDYLNNGYNYYFLREIKGSICFTKYGDNDIARFYLRIRNQNNYNKIVKMLYEAKDLYSLGSNDSKGKVIREYYPNLIMLQRSNQTRNTPPNKYNFSLSAIAEISENITIIANTSINVNDDINVNNKKKKKKTTVKGAELSQNHIDFDNVARQIVLRNMFTDFFGFIIKRESDHVSITYVEYNVRYKPCPKDLNISECKRCKGKSMLIIMRKILNTFNG
ncbi:hypothetical protein YYC_05051 [Plasmodium yoelii 17X]|uniref:Fam-a protein n=1 Tax=Plasmodium yoelii 17X TaxID=1323249 RepID=V7PCV4_PLAYE|nr:hypothetical protein YYC_05051 [Plasmodium yoelii 17X]